MENTIIDNQFEDRFKPIQNHLDDNASWGGAMFETYGEEMAFVLEVHEKNPNRVWTIMDGEDNDMFIGNGLSYVNRVGYIITEVPFEGDGFIEVDCS